MTTIANCTLCGEPMPEGETMFKSHGYSGPCPKPSIRLNKVDDDLEYPAGYCHDPNGKMNIPAGQEEAFNFGYEIGFREAMAIKMGAIK